MAQTNYYSLCCRYHGKHVRITTINGEVHSGVITRVDREKVWIKPVDNLGGYGYGFYGPYPRYGFGFGRFGLGIALGAIAGLALAPVFFW